METIIMNNNREKYNNINEKNRSRIFSFNLFVKNNKLIIFNIIILFYLIIDKILTKREIKELLKLKNIIMKNSLKEKATNFYNTIDKDMIGLHYPEISFEEIKANLMNNKFKSSLIKFLEELEIKLIYLEKEINATKINAFYTARTLLLKERNIKYDDSNITELHNIVSWLIIHRSTQLKGIVSDKYLVCKYAKMKLGIDLCPQRIGVFNSVDEIDFNNITKLGNVILKISNGNNDNTYILNNTHYDLEQLKKQVEKSFYRNFPLIDKVFSHCYSKKRIILEKMFLPMSDLYEFKFVVLNKEIKIIYVRVNYNNELFIFYYDSNYNPQYEVKNDIFNINNFNKTILNKLKYYALKLSEDFPNFIRIDLYLFHEEIYLSELTFDHREGNPFLRDNKIIKEAGENWKRIDCGDL